MRLRLHGAGADSSQHMPSLMLCASLQSAAFDSVLDCMRDAGCVVIDRAPRTPPSSHRCERLTQLPSARKLLLDAKGSEFAACGIECAQGQMEIEL